MWCCHDFLVYRVRLLEPGDAFLPACCRMACVVVFFFAKQNLEWRIYDFSTQTTPLLINSFNASNHRDVLKKNGYQSETCLVHFIVGFSDSILKPFYLFLHLCSQKSQNHPSLCQRSKSVHEAEESRDRVCVLRA